MKVRRFYPRQVFNRLRKRKTGTHSRGEMHAVWFFMLRANVTGYSKEQVQALAKAIPERTQLTGLTIRVNASHKIEIARATPASPE